MTTPSTTSTTFRAVYIEPRLLPDQCRPGHVVRQDGTTLIYLDPRTTRMDAVAWGDAHLTDWERTTIRAHYAQPPVGQPMDDDLVCDDLLISIPPSLRLPGPGERAGLRLVV